MQVVLYFMSIVLAWWFWPHCARPLLTARKAPAPAVGLVLGLTVLLIAASALSAVAVVAHLFSWPVWWATTIIGGLWIVVVGIGYEQKYVPLIRATRRLTRLR